MEQLTDFFINIFDTSKWPPRWYCGYWSDFHGWLYIASDVLIWLAYMTIPVILIRFIRKKEGVPLPKVFILFGLFILFCGFTHLIDAIIFWEPIYRFSALIRFMTGVISVATVFALIKYFDEAVGLKTSKEFEFELNYRRQAINELQQSNKDLSDFAYAASHDLKSPINTISSYLEYLEANYSSQLDERGQKMIETSVVSAKRMRILIEDLLEYSQVGRDQKIEKTDLNLLLDEYLASIEKLVLDSKVKIFYENLPSILCDSSNFRTIFSNLIENSIKYKNDGIDPVIKIDSEEKENFWLFSIVDNGIGMEEKYSDKVFQLFQRLHNRSQLEGTGIGLATVAKVIETYGGKIWYKSTLGKGTTFYFEIPKIVKLTKQYEEET